MNQIKTCEPVERILASLQVEPGYSDLALQDNTLHVVYGKHGGVASYLLHAWQRDIIAGELRRPPRYIV